jgi:hypothetical protein
LRPLPLQVLWVRRVFATYLTVIEDSTDPSCLRTHFHLLRSVRGGHEGCWGIGRSGMMSVQEGGWGEACECQQTDGVVAVNAFPSVPGWGSG